MKTIFSLLLLVPALASAEVFKCTDDKGHTTYANKPCEGRAVAYDGERTSIVDGVGYVLSLSRGTEGVFMTPGQVNNVPLMFMIDTGASFTTLSSDAGRKLGITQCIPVGVTNTANGQTSFCRVDVSLLGFGKFEFRDLTVRLNPTMRGVSLLGADLLRQLKLQQNGDVMTISRGLVATGTSPAFPRAVAKAPETVLPKFAPSSNCKREELELENVRSSMRAGYPASLSNYWHERQRRAVKAVYDCQGRLKN